MFHRAGREDNTTQYCFFGLRRRCVGNRTIRSRNVSSHTAFRVRSYRGDNMQATSGLARRTTLVQFVVLKREDKWVVKAKELERVFSAQHKAVEAAIKLAND